MTWTGILPLFKPKGMTSHDCVFRLRNILKQKSIGHTGTLDPDVEGVLPICLGRATKIAQFITNEKKSYKGTIALGKTTTTEDQSGETIEEKKITEPISRSEILELFDSFIGDLKQTPPWYSAVKVNGRKLYEYARQGIEVERPEREVKIYAMRLESDQLLFNEAIPFSVECSKGTYVRTLAVDAGKQLGYPAHLKDLVRTSSGLFSLDHCITFDDIEIALSEGSLDRFLVSIGEALRSMPIFEVDPLTEQKVMNGAVLPITKDFQSGPLAVYNDKGECLALYDEHPEKPGLMKPIRVIKIKENF